jgi:uncharacterized protein DUF5857
MSHCKTSCLGGQFNAGSPTPFIQPDLQDLDINNSKAYTTGCSIDGLYCDNTSLGYNIFPDNGEYIGVSSNSACLTCNNNTGCDYSVYGTDKNPCKCCCNYGAPRSGTRCAVQRNSYLGDPASCCFLATSKNLDSAMTGNTGDFFYWDKVQYNTYTCDPKYRDGSGCAEAASNIALQCSWLAKPNTRKAWTTGDPTPDEPYGYCTNFINNIDSATNQVAINNVLQSAVSALADDKGGTYSDFGISQPENAPFIANILSGCKSKGQGSCDTGLSNLCSKYTRDDIFNFYTKYLELQKKTSKTDYENNLQLAYANVFSACGCHLPKKDYAKWNKIGVDESNFSCDPLCMLPGVLRQWINNQEATCDQNLCILDNITIDILNSNVPGGITFTTICGDCGSSPGGCRCIFSGIDIFQSGSSVGNINFQQSCGGNCQIPDPNQEGNFIPIDCKTGFPISGGGPKNPSTFTSVMKWLSDHAAIVIVLIVVFLVLIITIIWVTQKKPHTRKGPGESVTLSDMFSDFDDYVSYY